MQKKVHPSSRAAERERFMGTMAQHMFEAEAEFRRETNQNGTFFFGLTKVCMEHLQTHGQIVTKEDRWFIPPPSPAIEGNFSASLFFESRLFLDVAEFSTSSAETLGIIAVFLEKHVIPAFTEQFRLQLAFRESPASQPRHTPW